MRQKDYVESLCIKYVGQSFELSVQIFHSHKKRQRIDSDKKNVIMIVIVVKNHTQEKL